MAEATKPRRKPNRGSFPPGNGGWGGAKRGGQSASKAGVAGPGRGITGKSVAEIMAAAGARELAAERWMAILEDPTHPKHADMIAKAADRLDGAPIQRNELSGADGGPMVIRRVIVDPHGPGDA